MVPAGRNDAQRRPRRFGLKCGERSQFETIEFGRISEIGD